MRKYKLIYFFIIIIILIAIQGCSKNNSNEVKDLTGTLVWSANYGTNPTKIYGSDLNKSLSEPILYYSNDDYKRIYFPSKTENSMIYVGINQEGENDIFEVANGVAASLLKKDDEILFPVMLPSKNIIYLGIDKNNNSYMGIYSSTKKEDKVLGKEDINTDCRPSVTKNGSTLFVTKSEDENWINIMDSDGNIKEILKGEYPVWLEDEKKFIYYYDRDIIIYNLLTNKSQKIKKNITMEATPVISPDKKYMAIFELDTVAFFGGETVDYLRVIPIADGEKAEVSAFHKTGRIESWGGLEWIE